MTDIAVYRPSTSTWYVKDQFKVTFGEPGDEPIPLDIDGDGRSEIVVYRRSQRVWLIFNPQTGFSDQISYGQSGDVPVGMAPFRRLKEIEEEELEEEQSSSPCKSWFCRGYGG